MFFTDAAGEKGCSALGAGPEISLAASAPHSAAEAVHFQSRAAVPLGRIHGGKRWMFSTYAGLFRSGCL